MSGLAMLQCVPCKGGTPPLRGPGLDDLLARVCNDWRVVEEHHLEKEFRFKDFRKALDVTIRIGDLAEQQGHHHDIYLAWAVLHVLHPEVIRRVKVGATLFILLGSFLMGAGIL